MNLDRIIAVRNDKTVYRDGDRCLKVFVGGRRLSDIYREATNQAILDEAGLRVPHVLGIADVDGRWAIISEYIKGKSLLRLAEEHPSRTVEYAKLLSDVHRQIHAKTSVALCRQRDKLAAAIENPNLSDAVRRMLKNQAEALPDADCICHGDFHPSNIMITPNGTPYILDCPLAFAGDPLLDVAIGYRKLSLHIPDMAEAYLSFYCADSGTDDAAVLERAPLADAFLLLTVGADDRRRLLSMPERASEPSRFILS